MGLAMGSLLSSRISARAAPAPLARRHCGGPAPRSSTARGLRVLWSKPVSPRVQTVSMHHLPGPLKGAIAPDGDLRHNGGHAPDTASGRGAGGTEAQEAAGPWHQGRKERCTVTDEI